jgi:hypothetical protein
MTTQNLGNPQILPAARPVSTFIQPLLRRQTAGAAQPLSIAASNNNFGLVRQQSGGNVQGFYENNDRSRQIQAAGQARASKLNQLANALEPFGATLLRTAQAGLELYASNEYQAGQNEAMRAYGQAQAQIDQGELVYGAQNRELARQSPMAALSMDRVNPYRAAGRERQLSQLAGAEVEQAIKTTWRARAAELSQLESNDPRINEVKADVISQVTERFGLSEQSQGFLQYTLPKINAGWDWFTDQQFQGRQGYLKQVQTGLLSNFILSQAPQMLLDGANPAEVAGWMNATIADQAKRRGLPGEPAQLRKEVLEQVYQVALASGNADLAATVAPLLPAAGINPMEVIGMEDRMDERQFRQMERMQATQEQSFRDELAVMASQTSDPQALMAGAQQLLSNDPRFQGLSPAKANKALMETIDLGNDLAMQLGATEGIDSLMLQLEGLPPSQFNQSKVEILQMVEAQLQGLPPEERRRYRERVAELSQQMEGRAVALSPVAEREIENVIKSRIAQAYPNINSAALAGASSDQIMQIIGAGGAGAVQSYEKLRRALLMRSEAAIAEREAQKGGRLTPGEISAVIGEVSQKLTPQNYPDLYPGSTSLQPGQPSAKPQAGAASSQPGATSSAAPAKTPAYGVSQLDQMPNRGPALKAWQSQAVLTLPSATQAMQQAAGGGRAAFSPALVRAARDAGTDPGTFLIRQLELYRKPDGSPAVVVPPAMRNQVIRQGRDAAAQSAYGKTLVERAGGALGEFGGWLLNTITGTRPAGAATLEPVALRPRPAAQAPAQPGQQQVAAAPTRPTTGAVQGLTVVSHPDTGRGFTMPGMRDYKGRPVVLSQPAMASFAQMVRDSGGQVKASDIASSQRSPGKNRAVGGAEGSNHLEGGAIDIHGASKAWIKANGARYGWKLLVYDGHDGHFDYVGAGSAGGNAVSASPRLAGLRGQGGGIFMGGPRGPAGAALLQMVGGSQAPGAAARLALPRSGGGTPGRMTTASSGQSGNVNRFLDGLAFLESDFGVNSGNGGGSFQFTHGTAKWASEAAGLDYNKLRRGDRAEVIRFIQWRHPDGYEAILRGDWERAARLMNGTWVSLPGGSQSTQRPERYARWRQIVSGGR